MQILLEDNYLNRVILIDGQNLSLSEQVAGYLPQLWGFFMDSKHVTILDVAGGKTHFITDGKLDMNPHSTVKAIHFDGEKLTIRTREKTFEFDLKAHYYSIAVAKNAIIIRREMDNDAEISVTFIGW